MLDRRLAGAFLEEALSPEDAHRYLAEIDFP